jgi:positive regulator of sigma E activity
MHTWYAIETGHAVILCNQQGSGSRCHADRFSKKDGVTGGMQAYFTKKKKETGHVDILVNQYN